MPRGLDSSQDPRRQVSRDPFATNAIHTLALDRTVQRHGLKPKQANDLQGFAPVDLGGYTARRNSGLSHRSAMKTMP